MKDVLTRLVHTLNEIPEKTTSQIKVWDKKINSSISNVDKKIKELTLWQNSKDVEKVSKFEFDLSDLDANTMYPVIFRFGRGPASKIPFGEVNIGREYFWNRRNPSPFSDNKSITHISGLQFRIVGSDHPWGGAGWHGVRVEMYDINYMHTMQLFTEHRMPIYTQKKDDTKFTANNKVPPKLGGGTPIYSGFYLRGGLLYRGYTKGMGIEPKLFTEPTRIYNNSHYNRSEWVAPFPYSPKNNSKQINNYGA